MKYPHCLDSVDIPSGHRGLSGIPIETLLESDDKQRIVLSLHLSHFTNAMGEALIQPVSELLWNYFVICLEAIPGCSTFEDYKHQCDTLLETHYSSNENSLGILENNINFDRLRYFIQAYFQDNLDSNVLASPLHNDPTSHPNGFTPKILENLIYLFDNLYARRPQTFHGISLTTVEKIASAKDRIAISEHESLEKFDHLVSLMSSKLKPVETLLKARALLPEQEDGKGC